MSVKNSITYMFIYYIHIHTCLHIGIPLELGQSSITTVYMDVYIVYTGMCIYTDISQIYISIHTYFYIHY